MKYNMHHRMGSYFETQGVIIPPAPHPPPKKGILMAPSGPPPPPPPPTSSIPTRKAKEATMASSADLVKSERSRRNLQRLKFEYDDMRQITALNKRLASLTIADMSPKLALQRILALYERGDHREAAGFIRRLTYATFRQLVDDLPMTAFLENAMPHSLPILEAIYAKLNSNGSSINTPEHYSPEHVVWQIVKYFASQDEESVSAGQNPRWEMCGPWVSTCKRLLSVLLTAQPRMKRVVAERRKALTKAIEGLGQHGLVGTSDESLLSLHEALKLQFDQVQKTYADANAKLDSLKGHGIKVPCKAPVAQSHQRQLSLKASEIQERLIKNKSLLNVVEPTLENHSLEVLLGILQRRIELDKEVLFQFTQLKKEIKLLCGGKNDPSVAPLLMRFQRGCQQVLDLMKEVSEEAEPFDPGDNETGSDYSGYHSDSDSTVMMSGNSPFISKSARYNFLSRSVRAGSKHHLRTSLSVNSSSSEANKSATNANPVNKNSKSPSSSGFSSIGNSSCSSGSGSPPDSDTNSHNDEQRSTASTANSPIVITRAVINIKANGEAETTSAMTSAPTGTPSTARIVDSSINRVTASVRCRKFNKKLSDTNYTNKNNNKNPRHIYHGVGKTILEDISDDEDEDNIQENDHPSEDQLHHLKKTEQQQQISNKKVEEELSRLQNALDRAKNSIAFLKERERKLKDRLQEAQQMNAEMASTIDPIGLKPTSTSSMVVIYDVQNGDKRPANLVRSFGELYSVARLETLDDLDTIDELVDADELKNKLLFSVVVLSFRSAMSSLEKIRDQFRKILQLPSSKSLSMAGKEVETAFLTYMRRACDTFDLTKNIEEVTSQIWATLYDYPCLKKCQGLKTYIEKCVRVSWGLVNQIPQYVIEYEMRTFKPDLHVRFHSSNGSESSIRTYLWPALKEGKTGPCVYKAVVLT